MTELQLTLPPTQLAVVAEMLGISDLPFPLRLPLPTTSLAERAHVREHMPGHLVISRNGYTRVHEDVEDALLCLTEGANTFVSVFGQFRGAEHGGVVVARGAYTLVAKECGDELTLRGVTRTRLAGEAAALLPPAPAGSHPEVRLSGSPSRDIQQLYESRHGSGVVTACSPRRQYRIGVVDTANGRYVTSKREGGATVVTPCGTTDLAAQLARDLRR